MAAPRSDQRLLTLPYMVRWFSPTLLANAAVRAVISPVMGTFADPRAPQASPDGFEPEALQAVANRYDYSDPASLDENAPSGSIISPIRGMDLIQLTPWPRWLRRTS